MKQINIRRAQPIGDRGPEETTIHLSEIFPEMDLRNPGAIVDLFQSDAQALCDTLHSTLPGGTFDRLLGLMLAKTATQFVVPHQPEAK